MKKRERLAGLMAALLAMLMLWPGTGMGENATDAVNTAAGSVGAETTVPEEYTLNWYYNIETGYFMAPVYPEEEWSETDWDGEGYGTSYVTDADGNAVITGFPAWDTGLPESLNGHPVTAIGRLKVFSQLDYPEEVTLPATVDRIEDMAFASFPRMPWIVLAGENPHFAVRDRMLLEPETGRLILRFDDGAAWTKNPDGSWSLPKELTVAQVPEELRKIDGYAFRGQGLTEIRLPEGLRTIGDGAFSGCVELRKINIPASVTDMGGNPFFGCPALETVELPENHPVFELRDGLLIRKADQCLVAALPAAVREGRLTIPESIRSIGDFAFYGLPLRELTIPDTVGSIGTGALAFCTELRTVTLPEGLTEIAPLLLAETGLEAADVPARVESIGSYAFSGTGIPALQLPMGLITLEKSALDRTGLKRLELPGSLREVGDWALANNPLLKRVDFRAAAERIGDFAFYNCEALQSVYLQEGFSTIGESAFEYCENLEYLSLPEGVTALGRNAFHSCGKLRWCELPESLTEIGEAAFFECRELSSLRIPGSVKTIERDLCSGCEELYSLELEEGIERIGDYAFSRCRQIRALLLPDSLRSIGENAFSYCSRLTEVTVPEGVTEIGKDAFRKCSEKLVVQVRKDSFGEKYCVGNGLQVFTGSAEKQEVSLQWTMDLDREPFECPVYSWERSTKDYSFGYLVGLDGNATITRVSWGVGEIPEILDGHPVTAVARMAIYDHLDGIDFLFIPASVTRIEPMAFALLPYTPKIFLREGNPRFIVENDMLLDPETDRLLLRYDEERAGIEMGEDDWEYRELPIQKRIEVPAGIRVIDGYAFRDQAMEEVRLPEGLREIGEGAFSGCRDLKRVNIPDSVTELGANPFFGCGALENITISRDHPVFEIRDGLLIRKADQTLVAVLPQSVKNGVLTIPESIRRIGKFAGRGMSMTSAVIPDSVSAIEDGAFMNCGNLQAIRLPQGLTEMAPAVLAGTGLKTVVLPETLEAIGDCAFDRIGGLEEITIPESVRRIGYAAFSDCGDLKAATLPDGVESIGQEAFGNCSRDLILRVEPGSYGEKYCRESGLGTQLKTE